MPRHPAHCAQYNSTLIVDEFGAGEIYWSSGRLFPEPFGQRNTTTTKLSWRETEDGLVLRAERLLGMMQVRCACCSCMQQDKGVCTT